MRTKPLCLVKLLNWYLLPGFGEKFDLLGQECVDVVQGDPIGGQVTKQS